MAKLATPTEHAEQAALVERLKRCGVVFFTVPNGAHLAGDENERARHIRKLKREGFTEGAPDLVLWGQAGNSRAGPVALEMKKRKGGRQSEAQKRMQADIEGVGGVYLVGRGALGAVELLEGVGYDLATV